MKCYQEVACPNCRCSHIMKSGKNAQNIQRYRCKNSACPTITFMLDYCYNACVPGVKEKVVEMAINSSGIRDTARVLKIDKNTVISILKSKEDSLVQVNPIFLSENTEKPLDVCLELVCEEAEIDEQWSFVGKKSNQRWLWHAVDHATNTVLAYVFGKRKDDVFKELKALLTPFKINRYYTDDWGAYERNLETSEHEIGKQNTQKIERKNLNFRTWIKRLTRRTICFSKIEKMHDIVIGLLINKVEFGRDIHA
jgi:IS1 family transposase/transposase-like protein